MMEMNQKQLQEMFDYSSDGSLIRKVAVSGRSGQAGRKIGSVGTSNSNSYLITKIHGKNYKVHRLIYLWHHGYMPEQVDHINKDSLDNRIENLRAASSSQNMMNRSLFSNSTSKVKGVSWHKRAKKWFAYVDVNKKRTNIGYFSDLELAELVASEARHKFHGAFAV